VSGKRAVLIVPPHAAMTEIEMIRRRFDTLADAIPAHVTIVFPFESELSDERLRHHIESATRDVHPFEIELAGFSCVEDQYLFLNVEAGSDQIREIHRRLYKGPLAPFLVARPFTPHVTVGRFGTAKECASAVEHLEGKELQVKALARSAVVYDLRTTPYSIKFEVEWR
jgi:2'-5' RNA ligase